MFDFIKVIEIFFNTYLDLNDREQPDDPPVQNETDFDCLKKKISELFLIKEMPKEFYDLWSFCKRLCSTHPEGLILSLFTLIIFA